MKNNASYSSTMHFSTFALFRKINAVAESAFSELGLTTSDAYLIMNINEKPNIQPTELSEKLILAPSTITRMVEKLEKRDLVRRKSESKYTYISTTEKGAALNVEILATWQKIEEKYSSMFGNKLETVIKNNLNAIEIAHQ